MDWVKAIDTDNLLLFGTGNHMVKMWSVAKQSVVLEMAAGAGGKDNRVEAAFQFPRVLDIASSPRQPEFVVASDLFSATTLPTHSVQVHPFHAAEPSLSSPLNHSFPSPQPIPALMKTPSNPLHGTGYRPLDAH